MTYNCNKFRPLKIDLHGVGVGDHPQSVHQVGAGGHPVQQPGAATSKKKCRLSLECYCLLQQNSMFFEVLYTTYSFEDEVSLTFNPILRQECPRPGDAVYGEVVLCPREDEAEDEGPVLDQIDEHIEGAVESDEEV